MLWHRQVIFKSKGDKLCSSTECRIWTRGPRHQIASRLNARWQTDWAIEDQAKNLNSTARPYDQTAFSPLDPTVSWLSHLALRYKTGLISNQGRCISTVFKVTESYHKQWQCSCYLTMVMPFSKCLTAWIALCIGMIGVHVNNTPTSTARAVTSGRDLWSGALHLHHIVTIGSSKSVIYGLWAGNNFSGNHGFECELRLLGVLRVLYRGYQQAVILVGIMDLNVNWDYWEF